MIQWHQDIYSVAITISFLELFIIPDSRYLLTITPIPPLPVPVVTSVSLSPHGFAYSRCLLETESSGICLLVCVRVTAPCTLIAVVQVASGVGLL